MEQDIATQVVGLGGATDFSLWKLFLRADFVVKFVIILLIACSIFSWALIFDKIKLFKNINNSIQDFEKKFWKAKSAESFNNNLPANSNDPAILIFKSAMSELIKTKRQSSAIQTARVSRVLEIATDTEMKKVEKNFTFLATVGSTAPFIGLFGTVWGIMNAFGGLSQLTQVSITVVAPGISEALIATALGLFAAIPALVSYNWNLNKINSFVNEYSNFSEELIIIFSNQIDESQKP